MARLFTCGWENGTAADSHEGWDITTAFSPTLPTISTVNPRSGTYTMRFNTVGAGVGSQVSVVRKLVYNAADAHAVRIRFYPRVDTAPDQNCILLSFIGSGGTANQYAAVLKTNGKVGLYFLPSGGGGLWLQRGSDSVASFVNGDYLELMQDGINDDGELRLNGVTVAQATADTVGNPDEIRIGIVNSTTSGDVQADIKIDDIAINDETGSFQNSWPGAATGVVHLRPNAVGDNGAFTSSTGNPNWQNVDEVPIDNTVDGDNNNDSVLNETDDYNLDATPAAIGASDTIPVVMIGHQLNHVLPAFAATGVLRVKASSGGTVEESAALVKSGRAVFSVLEPRVHKLVLYDLPGASVAAWTKADLDTAQIGARISTGGSSVFRLLAVWLLVEHLAAPADRRRLLAKVA